MFGYQRPQWDELKDSGTRAAQLPTNTCQGLDYQPQSTLR